MNVKENERMPTSAKHYAYGVILAAGIIVVMTLWQWRPPLTPHFPIYCALAIVSSMLKFRLPGITGTYSPGFLCTLVGIVGFTLPETLAASCAGALVQSLWKAKHRPTIIQVLFNMASLVLSISLCFLIARVAIGYGLDAYRPAVLALLAAVHFFTNTMLVSGVLSLLHGRPLPQVCQEWYRWSFPYYLIGAAIVGLLPVAGHVTTPEQCLIVLPLLYLVHFFATIPTHTHRVMSDHHTTLGLGARVYLYAVISIAMLLLASGVLHWHPHNPARFWGYLALAVLAAALKVRLPGLASTLSLSFVVFLVAIVQLTYAETIVIAATATIVQTRWKAQQRPRPVQVAFNAACMVLSVSAPYLACRILLAPMLATSLSAPLFIATTLLYGTNTLLIAGILCLAERRPLRGLWQECYWWSFPYYVVGASAAALMITAAESVVWELSIAVFPLLTLLYITYRVHTVAADAPV
jgi:hypothetical protein